MTKIRRFHEVCDHRAVSGWCNADVNYTRPPLTYECVEELFHKAAFGDVRWAAYRRMTSSRSEVVDLGSWEKACAVDIDREGCR
jgi:hypothetical protein